MYRHYFIIAHRNLLRNKVYLLVNIGGLAVGTSVAKVALVGRGTISLSADLESSIPAGNRL